MIYGLYHHSHWQGAGPDTLIAVGSEDACRAGEDALSTCSFCAPGRVGSYQVGECYVTRRLRYRPSQCRRIPDDAVDWGRHDWHAWLHDDARGDY